jgi:hypothetical protein
MSDGRRPLGRRPPTDDLHVQKYGLTLQTVPDTPTPVVLGINWYQNFDAPQSINVHGKMQWWIGLEQDWGSIRGGHAICVKPDGITDTAGWVSFYDQGNEGACVGFSESRMMSQLNRKRYDAEWLYHQAQKSDEWPGEDYDGTSVRAGFDVLRTIGHRRKWGPFTLPENINEGISANRWAQNIVEVLACLHDDVNSDSVVLTNSWGKSYPHYVHLPLAALDRLLKEDGEAGIVTDR